jgi:glutaredoxin
MKVFDKDPFVLKSQAQLQRPNTLIIRYMSSCGHCHKADEALARRDYQEMFRELLGIEHFVAVDVRDPTQNSIANAEGFSHRGGVPMFYWRDSRAILHGPFSGTNFLSPAKIKAASTSSLSAAAAPKLTGGSRDCVMPEW